MEEFVKTKIGFTVALLAAVFALRPIIDTYGDIGFVIFGIKITTQLAFFITVGFLGIAVYFISLQFISTKRILIFSKISDIAYALSLSIPIVFLTLWILVFVSSLLSKVLPSVPTLVWNILVSIIVGVLSNFLTGGISRAIKRKDSESKLEDSKRKELEILSRAEQLISEGHYDLSLMESTKIMEVALGQAVAKATGKSEKYSMYKLVQEAQKLNLMSKQDFEQINNLRIKRNNAAHLVSEITKNEAAQALEVVKRLIKTIEFAGDIAGFNWLKVNRHEALRLLEGNDEAQIKTVVRHLWEAWINRDGAVSGEISEFFEALLKKHPHVVVSMFKKEKNQFATWLNQLDTQMFTEYIGGQKEQLELLKKCILSSLNLYIAKSSDSEDQMIAKTIYNKVASITIREID